MSEEEALLAAIRELPHDDTPRLVYADWLEEHGQSDRAEFIRVQIEAARLQWDAPRWDELAARAKELLESHGGKWIEPLRWLIPAEKFKVSLDKPRLDGGGSVQVGWVDPHPSDIGDSAPPYERGIEFRRGFPEVLFVEPDILQSLPADYKIAGPRLQLIIEWKYRGAPNHGWIEEMWPSVSRALQSSQFSDWTFTNFNYELRWLHPLANNPAVARRVSGLVIDNDGHTDETALTGLFPLMPSLNTLVLGGQGWSLAVIHELGRAGLSKRLEHLGFDCLGTADTIEAIASAGAWPQLLSMTLHQLTGVEPTALSPLRAGMFPGLQYLQLWEGPGVRNTAEFVTALLECPSLANVKRIEYGHYGTIHERQPAIREIEQRSAGRFVYR